MAPPAGPARKRGWTWRSNLVAGLIFAAIGAFIVWGGATRYGRPIQPVFGYVFLELGALTAAGLLTGSGAAPEERNGMVL